MAVVHSKTLFDRFQVETTGTSFAPLRSYLLRPNSAFRFEISIEAFDGSNVATFKRVLTVKRSLGTPEVVGRFWHCSETTKSHPAFDLRAIMNSDGSFSLEGKNPAVTPTLWRAVIERLALTR